MILNRSLGAGLAGPAGRTWGSADGEARTRYRRVPGIWEVHVSIRRPFGWWPLRACIYAGRFMQCCLPFNALVRR